MRSTSDVVVVIAVLAPRVQVVERQADVEVDVLTDSTQAPVRRCQTRPKPFAREHTLTTSEGDARLCRLTVIGTKRLNYARSLGDGLPAAGTVASRTWFPSRRSRWTFSRSAGQKSASFRSRSKREPSWCTRLPGHTEDITTRTRPRECAAMEDKDPLFWDRAKKRGPEGAAAGPWRPHVGVSRSFRPELGISYLGRKESCRVFSVEGRRNRDLVCENPETRPFRPRCHR